ncbi:MAG: hypothetical protein HQL80_09535 [Magnetococcales bacterium]|nr:hypothetical protein [Magnetococcales bacterium]
MSWREIGQGIAITRSSMAEDAVNFVATAHAFSEISCVYESILNLAMAGKSIAGHKVT